MEPEKVRLWVRPWADLEKLEVATFIDAAKGISKDEEDEKDS